MADDGACNEKVAISLHGTDGYDLNLKVPRTFWRGREPKLSSRMPFVLGAIQKPPNAPGPVLVTACLPNQGQYLQPVLRVYIAGRQDAVSIERTAQRLKNGGYKDEGIHGHFHRYVIPSSPSVGILISNPEDFVRPMTAVCTLDPDLPSPVGFNPCTAHLYYSPHIMVDFQISSPHPLADIQALNRDVVDLVRSFEPEPNN